MILSILKNKTHKQFFILTITLIAVGVGSDLLVPKNSHANSTRIKFSTSKISKKDKAVMIRKFQRQVVKANKSLQRSAVKGRRPMNITSINIVDDCSASVTCGNGEKISCSIQGPGSCESGTFSVACISANSETTDACGPTN